MNALETLFLVQALEVIEHHHVFENDNDREAHLVDEIQCSNFSLKSFRKKKKSKIVMAMENLGIIRSSIISLHSNRFHSFPNRLNLFVTIKNHQAD